MKAALVSILNGIGRVVGDRGFWTSATPYASFFIAKACHLSDAEALVWWRNIGGIAMVIDISLAAKPKGLLQ